MENQDFEIAAGQNLEQPGESTSGKSKKPIALITAGVIVGGVAIGLLLTSLSAPTKLQASVESCLLENNSSVSLDDDGKGLYLDGAGDESAGIPVSDAVCVLGALDVPDSVTSRMSNTTSLMGQQVAEWGDITAMWTYHPNNGLDISFELK